MKENTIENPAGLLAEILADLHDYLEFFREEGRTTLHVRNERLKPSASPPRPAATTPSPPGKQLEEIARRIAACRRCPLHESRTHPVPGQGNSAPDIAFIGEAPGFEEDRRGEAFVGAAGQLLTRIINAMGYTREEVWIGNIVKCRPPGNRAPMPDEMQACLPFLKQQLAILRPSVIVCLGSTAVKGLLGIQQGITRLRGNWMTFDGTDVMPTFHPAYLLRNPSAKAPVWTDMKAVLKRLGRRPPRR